MRPLWRPTRIGGLALFVVASAVCGLGTSIQHLVVGRVLQGLGAALLVPGSLSLIIHTYDESVKRSRAIATWASWGGLALVLGPLTGGVFIQLFDWRSIFLVNIPIGLAGVGMTLFIRQADNRDNNRDLDVAGQITAIIAVLSLIASLIEGPVHGWTSYPILCGFCLFALSGGAFLIAEMHGRAPMLPLSLFRNYNFSTIAYMFFAGSISFFGMLFVLSFYFQEVCRFSALETGFALFPLTLCVVLGNKISGRLVSRWTPRTLMLVGEILKAPGFLGLLLIRVNENYNLLIAPLCLIGLGGGLSAPMYTSLFMSSVDQAFTGVASGVSRATGQIGSAFGVAVFGALIANKAHFVDQMSLAVLVTFALTVSTILAIWLIVRDSAGVSYHGSKPRSGESLSARPHSADCA